MHTAVLAKVALTVAASLTTSPSYNATTDIIFPDGSIEICPTSTFIYNPNFIQVYVETCYPDTIFKNGFE